MSKYIVIEIQTNSEGVVSWLVDSFNDINAAESKYHTVLSFAAVSNLPVHACVMLSNEGFYIKHQCYKHGTPAPAVSNEEEEE